MVSTIKSRSIYGAYNGFMGIEMRVPGVFFCDMTYSIWPLSPNHFAMTGAVSCGLLMFQAVFMTLSFFDSMSTAFETVKHEHSPMP